jgi:hypothetical protein
VTHALDHLRQPHDLQLARVQLRALLLDRLPVGCSASVAWRSCASQRASAPTACSSSSFCARCSFSRFSIPCRRASKPALRSSAAWKRRP